MQNRDLLPHKPFNNSVFNSTFQTLNVYRYIFIASVLACLTGAYIYQTNTVTGYGASTVLEVSGSRQSKQVAAALAKQLREHTFSKALQASVNSVDRSTIVSGPKPTEITLKAKDQSQALAQVLLADLIIDYKQQLAAKAHTRVIDTQLTNSEISRLSGKLAVLQTKVQPAKNLPSKASSSPVSKKERQINERRSKVLEVILSYTNKPVNSFVVIPENFVAFDPTLQNWVIDFNEQQAYKQSILSDDDPDEAELNKTNQRIAATIKLIKQYAGRQKDSLTEVSQVNNNSESKFNKLAAGDRSPATKDELKAIQDSIKALQANLVVRPGKSSWQLIQRSYQVKPIHNKSFILYLVAMVIGLLVPASAIFILAKVSKKIIKLADINSLTGIEVAGRLEDATSAHTDSVTIPVNHSFAQLSRFLRNRLNMAQKTIWVTSGISEEGKRYFITGLARELAHTGSKVLVIDYSLENPDLLDELELTYNIGLQGYLSRDDIHMADLITASANYTNLHFIGAGVAREQLKMEMLSMLSQLDMPVVSEDSKKLTGRKVHEKFARLLESLKKQYDYILIAGPAMEENTDHFRLATLADISFFIVRLNYTHKAQLKQLNNLVNTGELVNPFIVVNMMRKQSEKSLQAEQDD